VALWTRDSTQDDANMKIGQILKAKLGIPDSETIRYEIHKDSAARTGSSVKPHLVIPSTINNMNGTARTRKFSNNLPHIGPNNQKSE
uniref:Uncharacterized protein n=1 Tax=Acrobeloides nanus TaxID=290746 RepID=A0A914CRK1_9BILA